MSEKMKRMKRELKYEGSIVKIYMDEIELPNGKIAKWLLQALCVSVKMVNAAPE